MPDPALAQTIAWIWLAILVAGMLVVLLYRLWRRRNPRRPPEVVAGFGQRLQQRLAQRRLHDAKRRRRKSRSGGRPRPR
jgi:type VI protein secretion system component VasK